MNQTTLFKEVYTVLWTWPDASTEEIFDLLRHDFPNDNPKWLKLTIRKFRATAIKTYDLLYN